MDKTSYFKNRSERMSSERNPILCLSIWLITYINLDNRTIKPIIGAFLGIELNTV